MTKSLRITNTINKMIGPECPNNTQIIWQISINCRLKTGATAETDNTRTDIAVIQLNQVSAADTAKVTGRQREVSAGKETRTAASERGPGNCPSRDIPLAFDSTLVKPGKELSDLSFCNWRFNFHTYFTTTCPKKKTSHMIHGSGSCHEKMNTKDEGPWMKMT